MNVQPHSSAPTNSSSDAPKGENGALDRAAECADISGRFRRSSKLLRHADFQRVYKQGRRHFATHMTVFYLARAGAHATSTGSDSKPRVGLTVGRVLGGAVQRNRIKRRMREAVRANLPALTAPVDVVINPKKSALDVDFMLLRREVARAFAVIQESFLPGKKNL